MFFYSMISFSQEGNLWRPFFEQAINFNENNEYVAAEEQFNKAQQLLLDEFGLNDNTIASYCHILYRRASNLFLIDGVQDSSYKYFKELYDLSQKLVDSISGEWFRTESTIMLSTIDLGNGNIRECCELLENEKQNVDKLNVETRLPHKYYFYKNLAETYNFLLVNLIHGKVNDYQFLCSPYVIIRDASFYNEYITVYKELVDLSVRYNKGNIKKLTEDYMLLASHCRIPDDDYLAYITFEKAFSLWDSYEKHNDIMYFKLCKEYLSYKNKSALHLLPTAEEKTIKEFDSYITNDSAFQYLSDIDLMDFYSVRIQDESLEFSQKRIYIKRMCDDLAKTDNFLILSHICNCSPEEESLVSINNLKILIKYLSLSSVLYYELGENSMADLLLNKAKFFSLRLPAGDRLLLEELNNAIAISAESIGDMETYYNYNAVNLTCKVAKGILPSDKEYLIFAKHGNIDEKITNLTNGINMFGTGKYDKDLLAFYIGLAEVYFESKNYSLSDENIAIADSISKLMTRDDNPIPFTLASDLLLCKAKSAFFKGDISNSQIQAKKSYEYSMNIDAVDFLAELYADNTKELDSIVSVQYRHTYSFILENYPFLSERERITFSQSKEFQWFESVSKYADRHLDDTLLLSIAYNSALYSKGINLFVSTVITDKARRNEENTTKENLNRYIELSTEHINDTSERTRNNRRFYLDILEKDMQRSSGVSPRLIEEHLGDWKKISSNLSDNEVAIEFVEYCPICNSELCDYYLSALYITSNSYPQLFRICKLSEIESIKDKFKYDAVDELSKIYDVIWKPILKETCNANKIWFSPSQNLYQINIEAALPDSIETHRVSSTRNLLSINDIPDYSKITLFGGLNYNEANDDVSDEIPNHTACNIIRGSNIVEERVGFSYLKGSLKEVVAAEKILSPINPNIQKYIDIYGTEKRFKSLSGTGVSLLHIATHGFYLENTDNISNVGNSIMRKSGLFMSGAKAIWKGMDENYFGDDGILLSEEIEKIDFSKLNMVVLSACGTGLGNPTNDGVYGLQRAFKEAGAQTIIMSLWNVDDNATALMMETFYQELIKTNSKYKAFKIAQKTIREKYEDPYYWAAFIMLD